MLTKFDFTHAQTSTVYHFHQDLSTDPSGFTSLDFDVERRVIKRQKSQAHGNWPTVPLKGGMDITIEGDLLANDSTDYVTKRLALAAAMEGNLTIIYPTNLKDGDIQLHFDGMTEDLKAAVMIDAFTSPLVGGYPGYSKYMITFWSPDPWFIGVTSGNKIPVI